MQTRFLEFFYTWISQPNGQDFFYLTRPCSCVVSTHKWQIKIEYVWILKFKDRKETSQSVFNSWTRGNEVCRMCSLKMGMCCDISMWLFIHVYIMRSEVLSCVGTIEKHYILSVNISRSIFFNINKNDRKNSLCTFECFPHGWMVLEHLKIRCTGRVSEEYTQTNLYLKPACR